MLLFISDDNVSINDKLDIYCSIAGGLPIFYNDEIMIPGCCHCHSQLSLLVQVYVPLDQAHRSIYVFYCSSSFCPHSNIIAKSFCSLDEEHFDPVEDGKDSDVKGVHSISDTWSLDETDDDNDDDDIDIQLQALVQQQRLDHITSTTSNLTQASSSKLTLCFHLALVYEPDKLSYSYQHELELLKKYEFEQEGSVDRTREDSFMAESYEQSSDPIFAKFQKRLDRDSRQCIRVGRGGQPLFMKHHDNVPQSKCHECGCERIFEMQLMPNLVHLLKLDHDWGTISIYTCANSCTRRKLIDEFVFIEDGF